MNSAYGLSEAVTTERIFVATHCTVTPYGRWRGWCVWARPALLAHHIQGDKVWRPGHADTWSYPGTQQRHASLWSRRGAQNTLLRQRRFSVALPGTFWTYWRSGSKATSKRGRDAKRDGAATQAATSSTQCGGVHRPETAADRRPVSPGTLTTVSSKPKEPGATVVAPGHGSAQSSVWQSLHRWRTRSSRTEVRAPVPSVSFWRSGLLKHCQIEHGSVLGIIKKKKKVTAGRRQPTFIQGVFSFQEEDAMMSWDNSPGQCSYFGIHVV